MLVLRWLPVFKSAVGSTFHNHLPLLLLFLLTPGAYYVEKHYAEAADAYSKSLAIFDMIDDVSVLVAGGDRDIILDGLGVRV